MRNPSRKLTDALKGDQYTKCKAAVAEQNICEAEIHALTREVIHGPMMSPITMLRREFEKGGRVHT